ncbi:MAG: histidinol-phosphatase [Spirochaetaceae bacterium]|nr:histidinol-phosphatase [Spirochaetaceae bacterium]
MLFSYHTHCDFCDGKASAPVMAQAAFDKGYSFLGFSSHAPLPFPAKGALPWASMAAYASAIRSLQAAWAPRGMTILLGLEIDSLGDSAPSGSTVTWPGYPGYSSIEPDFRIGSVHYVQFDGSERFTVDQPATAFAQNVRRCAHGDADLVWKAYFRNLCSMIVHGGFDIIGHFDLVRKNNDGERWFDENSAAYRSAAFQAAELAAEKDLVVEINAGGLLRGKTEAIYPSLTLLKQMHEKKIRITFGDDAHAPQHLGPGQRLAADMAKAAGYKSVWFLDGNLQWQELGIEGAGVAGVAPCPLKIKLD